MKTIYLILCFTCLGFWTEFAPAADTNNYGQALREALQRAEHQRTNSSSGTVPSAPAQPAKENSNAPAAPPARRAPILPPKAVTPPAAKASPANANANQAGVPSLPSAPKPAPATVGSVPRPGVRPAVNNQAASPAPGASSASEEMVPAGIINFSGADLGQVLDIYAEFVNRTILRPANLPSPLITLKTQTPLTKAQVIQALDAVLALNGITMIDVGDKFVKAVPVAQAGQEAGAFNKEKASQLPDLGQYVTHVVQLKYVKPSEVVPALQPFAKAPNAILAIDSSQILVLRDYTENVKRMLQLVDKIDVSAPAEFVSEVIPIKYALASDIADALNSLSTGGGVTSVGGSSRGGRTPMGGGMNTRSAYGSPYGNTMNTGSSMMRPQSITMTPQATPPQQSSFTQRLRNIMNRAGVGGKDEIQILGPTKIIADQRSNSLLIFATREDMKTIKGIVAKLDVLLPQVLIESVIMDVSLNNQWSLGVSALQKPRTYSPSLPLVGAGGYNNGQPFADFLTNAISLIGTNTLSNLTGGYFSYFANIGPHWDVAMQAAASDNNVTIIQRPRIQTSQAKEAQFFVGQTVPYVSQVYYSGLGTGPSSSYQQMQVGIQLDVTPFINPNGLVVMDINQEIDDLNGSTHIDGVGDVPNTIKRTLSSEIAVRDRDTIILGGFIRAQNQRSKSGVPLLQDIPLLGALFSSRSSQKNRDELLVLMRPTVLRTPEIAAAQVAEEEKRLPGIHRAAIEEQLNEREEMQQQNAELQRELSKHKGASYPGMTPDFTNSVLQPNNP